MICNAFSTEGILATIKNDEVASRFVLMASIDFRKLLIMTVIGFFALFGAYYLSKSMDFTKSSINNPIQQFRESLPFYSTIEHYSPYILVIVTLIAMGLFTGVIVNAAKENKKRKEKR